jgi:hypothetical protein
MACGFCRKITPFLVVESLANGQRPTDFLRIIMELAISDNLLRLASEMPNSLS